REDRRGDARLTRRRAERPGGAQGRLARACGRRGCRRGAELRRRRRCGRRAPPGGAARRHDAPHRRGRARARRAAAADPGRPSPAGAGCPGRGPASLSARAVSGITLGAMAEPIRLVLVEDNQVFREALELLLGLQSDIEVVASVGDGSSAAEVVRTHKPDVVLMDYRLPGLDGVQATRAVREAYPDVAVVCLTASANFREVDALYAAGAVACLSKDQELDEIVDAIRQAA